MDVINLGITTRPIAHLHLLGHDRIIASSVIVVRARSLVLVPLRDALFEFVDALLAAESVILLLHTPPQLIGTT
jgi:hypothetical protein